MRLTLPFDSGRTTRREGFTLTEVIVAIAITALVIGSLINGYIIAVKRSQWTAMSDAAQEVVLRKMEQVRAARWDLTASTPIDELVATNFPDAVEMLYTPLTGTNTTYATNITMITVISQDPPMKLIQTDCYWQFDNGRFFTNTLILYRSPDP